MKNMARNGVIFDCNENAANSEENYDVSLTVPLGHSNRNRYAVVKKMSVCIGLIQSSRS